jgi:hypothetical protein
MMPRTNSLLIWIAAAFLLGVSAFVVFGQFYGQAARTENQVPQHADR